MGRWSTRSPWALPVMAVLGVYGTVLHRKAFAIGVLSNGPVPPAVLPLVREISLAAVASTPGATRSLP